MTSQELGQETMPTQDLPANQREPSSRVTSALDRSLFSVVNLNWELVAWVLLLIVASTLRFVDVGTRAMSHDESLHALYSYYLYDTGNYEHNPMMHGTLLFHMNALAYFLFGDNDTTARIPPVLFGIATVWIMWLFRRYIGRTGALVAAILITISPSLLFHSRYIRNDIYIAFFLLVWIYGAFRYLETRHIRWLMVMTMGMAWGFVAKENHFMNGAIMGGFFVGLALWQQVGQRLWLAIAPVAIGGGIWYWLHIRARELATQAASAGDGAEALLSQSDRSELMGLVALGIAGLIALGVVVSAMKLDQWVQLRRSASADLAIVMASLVLPFVSPFLLALVFRWDLKAKFDNINSWSTNEMLLTAMLVLILTLISCAIAYFWFAMRPDAESTAAAEEQEQTELQVGFVGWLQLMGAFWLIQILFFTTFLTNIRNGLATGIVGSLGYWLAQQEVARGGQPWYYYLMLGGLYEFLPWILSGAGMIAIIYWLLQRQDWDPVAETDLPATVRAEVVINGQHSAPRIAEQRQIRIYFAVFGIWWVIATWLAYTVAGEKMPWLMTHMALTMCVVGGWWFGRLLGRIDWQHAWQRRTVWLIAITPALVISLLTLVGATPSVDRSLGALAGNMQRVLALLICGGLFYLIWRWGNSSSWFSVARMLTVGFVALLLLLTIRFSYMLTYINYDMATEYLVYAHASPDVKRALDEIDSISERTVGGRNIVVAYDNESSWPMSWYMRLYPNHKFYGSAPNSDNMSAPIIIVGPDNYDKVHPYVMRDYVKRTYRLVWWPDMDYFNMTWERFFNAFLDPQQRERVLQIAFYRRYRDTSDYSRFRDLAQWPHRHEFEMWVRRDLATQIWDLGVAPVVEMGNSVDDQAIKTEIVLEALATYSGVYGDKALLNPREVAVGPNGVRLIADSGNHRIVQLDRDGNLLWATGSLCRLSEGEAGGCSDPDGSGPLAMGDGQFNEPWGVTVDQAGRVYVADTWNGRIQVFDSEGKFIAKWGTFNTTNGELGDAYALFGPRGLAIDGDGNLLVADTGNKRIIKYTPEGQLVQQIGGGGVVGGRFEEPVGVAVSSMDGSVYVADTWNQRIQKLSPSLEFVEEWATAGWDSQEIYDKPYLAVATTGDVYVSDPQFFRVVVYGPTGEIKGAFGTFGTGPANLNLPTGIAIDPETNIILVADANNNRIQSFAPLP